MGISVAYFHPFERKMFYLFGEKFAPLRYHPLSSRRKIESYDVTAFMNEDTIIVSSGRLLHSSIQTTSRLRNASRSREA